MSFFRNSRCFATSFFFSESLGAVQARDRLYQEMTPSERAEAQKLTREWRAKVESFFPGENTNACNVQYNFCAMKHIIPPEWIREAGLQSFEPSTPGYHCDDEHQL